VTTPVGAERIDEARPFSLEAAVPRDISALIADLDLDEKAALLAGADLWSTVAVDRLGIPAVGLTDGPNGARGQGLPAGMGEATDTSTCVPSGSGLGATWDVELLDRVGSVIGREARMKACRFLLGPTVNLHRSPLGGRNFESYSEDPLLAGRLGAAWVRGAQSQGVICTVKHFAGNEQEEGRMLVDTVVDERTLRELHLLPFELAVREGGALGIMSSYNRLNGEYVADSTRLIADVLRGEWGFEGVVVTDWFAFAETAKAIAAGLDLEMPGPGRAYGPALAELVREGGIDESLVDAALARLFGVLDRVGALDSPDGPPRSDDLPEHRAVAREASRSSMVLLRNEGVLPLAGEGLRKVAVIGPNADRAVIMGGGSSSLSVAELRAPLDAIRDRLGPGVEVVFETGVDIRLVTPEIPAELLTHAGGNGLVVESFALDDLGGEVRHHEVLPTGLVMWMGSPNGAGDEFSWRGRATLTVPEADRWTLSLVQTGPAKLLVDGDVVIDGTVDELPWGGEFFGMARREQTVDLELSPDRPVQLEIQARSFGGFLRGAKVGLRRSLPADALQRAVDAARGADAVIVVVGTDGDWDTEGHDRAALGLPGEQDELVGRILDVAPDAIVAVNSGAVVTLPWAHRCRALLQCWFGGVEMAEALTDVLLGVADPGGRLPTTIPHRIEDNPTWGNFPPEAGRIHYGERILVGYRWYDSRSIDVAFPFGHGLSYTTFEVGAPELSSASPAVGDTVTVRVPVTNTGTRAGSEVVQVYVAPRSPQAFRPPKELKGFAKVHLEPGASTTVEVTLDGRSFARWVDVDPAYQALVSRQTRDAAWMPMPADAGEAGWVVDSGTYDILVGRSSAEISHTVAVELAGGPLPR
jgi:beta-glucosidase